MPRRVLREVRLIGWSGSSVVSRLSIGEALAERFVSEITPSDEWEVQGLRFGLSTMGFRTDNSIQLRAEQVMMDSYEAIVRLMTAPYRYFAGLSCAICSNAHATWDCLDLLAMELKRESDHRLYLEVSMRTNADDLVAVRVAKKHYARSFVADFDAKARRYGGAGAWAMMLMKFGLRCLGLYPTLFYRFVRIVDTIMYIVSGSRLGPDFSGFRLLHSMVLRNLRPALPDIPDLPRQGDRPLMVWRRESESEDSFFSVVLGEPKGLSVVASVKVLLDMESGHAFIAGVSCLCEALSAHIMLDEFSARRRLDSVMLACQASGLLSMGESEYIQQILLDDHATGADSDPRSFLGMVAPFCRYTAKRARDVSDRRSAQWWRLSLECEFRTAEGPLGTRFTPRVRSRVRIPAF